LIEASWQWQRAFLKELCLFHILIFQSKELGQVLLIRQLHDRVDDLVHEMQEFFMRSLRALIIVVVPIIVHQ
jgi:hypothetical protein